MLEPEQSHPQSGHSSQHCDPSGTFTSLFHGAAACPGCTTAPKAALTAAPSCMMPSPGSNFNFGQSSGLKAANCCQSIGSCLQVTWFSHFPSANASLCAWLCAGVLAWGTACAASSYCARVIAHHGPSAQLGLPAGQAPSPRPLVLWCCTPCDCGIVPGDIRHGREVWLVPAQQQLVPSSLLAAGRQRALSARHSSSVSTSTCALSLGAQACREAEVWHRNRPVLALGQQQCLVQHPHSAPVTPAKGESY